MQSVCSLSYGGGCYRQNIHTYLCMAIITFDFFYIYILPVIQWRLGLARRIQAQLDAISSYFILSYRLDASKHFLENFLVISDRFWHKNFTDCFGGESFALDSNDGLQIFTKPFLFFSHQVPNTRTCITLANAVYHQCLQQKGTYRHFLIYHYITAFFYSHLCQSFSCLRVLSCFIMLNRTLNYIFYLLKASRVSYCNLALMHVKFLLCIVRII